MTTQEKFSKLLAAKAGLLAVLFDDPRVVKRDRDWLRGFVAKLQAGEITTTGEDEYCLTIMRKFILYDSRAY